jgi:hypothetical protein
MINESLAEAEFRKVCDEIWKPVTDTATDRSKTIAANRDAALTQLFVDADSNANIRGTNGPATRPSPSTSITRLQ